MRCQKPEGAAPRPEATWKLKQEPGSGLSPKLEPIHKDGFEPRQHLVREL